MEILVTRKWKGKNTTISTLTVNGMPFNFVLEDTDRGLDSMMSLEEIKELKVYGNTAIPTGTYKVTVNYSPRFKRKMPILLDVPGFSGIRIHAGNRHTNTEGCLLPGMSYYLEDSDYVISNSRVITDRLENAINNALARKETIWITIEADYK